MGISLLDQILSSRPSNPVRRSISCVCSRVKVLSGKVSFTIGLTRWVDRCRFRVTSVICFVCIGIIGNLTVGVRVCLTTDIVVVDLVIVVLVVLCLIFLSFDLTALVAVVSWLFAVVASWFGFFCVSLCGLLRHSIYLQLFWSFQTMWQKLFLYAILQMRLVHWFFMWGGILACINCSVFTWAATPNAFFTSSWSLSRNSVNFKFAGLDTSCLFFCRCTHWLSFHVFSMNKVRISPKFSLLKLVMFLNVSNASPSVGEWK